MADHLPEADPADAAEQHESAEGERADEVLAPLPHEPVSESDAQEQATPVGSQAHHERGPRPVEANEADWQEQSVVEPLDEDEIR